MEILGRKWLLIELPFGGQGPETSGELSAKSSPRKISELSSKLKSRI